MRDEKVPHMCYICIMQRIRLLIPAVLSLLSYVCCAAAGTPDALLGARKPTRSELRLHRNIENRMSFAVVRPDSAASDTLLDIPYSRCRSGKMPHARQVSVPEL